MLDTSESIPKTAQIANIKARGGKKDCEPVEKIFKGECNCMDK